MGKVWQQTCWAVRCRQESNSISARSRKACLRVAETRNSFAYRHRHATVGWAPETQKILLVFDACTLQLYSVPTVENSSSAPADWALAAGVNRYVSVFSVFCNFPAFGIA